MKAPHGQVNAEKPLIESIDLSYLMYLGQYLLSAHHPSLCGLQPPQNNGLYPRGCGAARRHDFTHHFAVRVLAQPRSELDGAHKDEEQAQSEREGHDGYCPWWGHLPPPRTLPAASPLMNERRTLPGEDAPGGRATGVPQKWRRAGSVCAASTAAHFHQTLLNLFLERLWEDPL